MASVAHGNCLIISAFYTILEATILRLLLIMRQKLKYYFGTLIRVFYLGQPTTDSYFLKLQPEQKISHPTGKREKTSPHKSQAVLFLHDASFTTTVPSDLGCSGRVYSSLNGISNTGLVDTSYITILGAF